MDLQDQLALQQYRKFADLLSKSEPTDMAMVITAMQHYRKKEVERDTPDPHLTSFTATKEQAKNVDKALDHNVGGGDSPPSEED